MLTTTKTLITGTQARTSTTIVLATRTPQIEYWIIRTVILHALHVHFFIFFIFVYFFPFSSHPRCKMTCFAPVVRTWALDDKFSVFYFYTQGGNINLLYFSGTTCDVVGWFSGSYSEVRIAWFRGVLPTSIQFPRDITNILLNSFSRLVRLVMPTCFFPTSIHGPLAPHLGHKLKRSVTLQCGPRTAGKRYLIPGWLVYIS